MKKIILATTLLAIVGAGVQTAKAGDREWATVGKVLTGVVAGAVIAKAVDAHANVTVHYSSAPAYAYGPPAPVVVAPAPVVYAPPPVVYAPAPVVVYRAPVYVAPRPVVVKHSYHKFHRHHGGRSHR